MLEKRALNLADMESQAAFELPDRDMMALVNIIIFDVIDGGVLNNLTLQVKNNNVAVQVCAIVNLISASGDYGFTCAVDQA